MTETELLAIYDTARRNVRLHGLVREEFAGEAGAVLVRHSTAEGAGTVLYAHLDPLSAGAAIQEQVETFRRRGATLEWLVYSHDRPADLGQRLQEHGFVAGEPETLLLLPLDEMRLPAAAPDLNVRRVSAPADLLAVATIRQQTWGGEVEALARRLQQQARERPEEVSIYLAAVEGVPAATAQLTHYPEHGFASLVSAATLPAYRCRGLYTALLRARLLEAQQRSIRFLDTEASPMSRPLLQRAGFRPISVVTTYVRER